VIGEAVQSGNAAAMTRAAHTLKSSSAQLGAARLSALCKDLETSGRADELSGTPDTFADIEAELEKVHEELILEREIPGDV
jgi:HPt (histidine-containing phosphotransfer) domain-containing protein